jgi:hypothetical protein
MLVSAIIPLIVRPPRIDGLSVIEERRPQAA